MKKSCASSWLFTKMYHGSYMTDMSKVCFFDTCKRSSEKHCQEPETIPFQFMVIANVLQREYVSYVQIDF
jgi:hypothetical protein